MIVNLIGVPFCMCNQVEDMQHLGLFYKGDVVRWLFMHENLHARSFFFFCRVSSYRHSIFSVSPSLSVLARSQTGYTLYVSVSAGCLASRSIFFCWWKFTFYPKPETSKYGNPSIAVIVRVLTPGDANFPGEGQRWSHVILEKLEWGCRIS